MCARPLDFSLYLIKAWWKIWKLEPSNRYGKKWKWSEKLEIVQIVQFKPVSVVHIVQYTSGGSGGFTRRETAEAYRNIGTQEKARQQLANGLIYVFLFILHI